jgi:glycosyltransferase involved in cell wall biosynthesis
MNTPPLLCVSATRQSTERLLENGPRRDFLELASAVGGELLYRDSDGLVSRGWRGRIFGPHLRQAWRAAREVSGGGAVFADGEHIGLPLLFFLALRVKRPRVVMLGHLPSRRWKRALFWLGTRLTSEGTLVLHSQAQQALLRGTLAGSWTVRLVPYQVDTTFWNLPGRRNGDIVVAVGAENRDYETLLAAARSLPDLRFVVAAGSHWARSARTSDDTPPNVGFLTEPLDFADLRDLYARAAVVVVPLNDVPNQSGITTLLEGMSMERAVIVTANAGQRECVTGPLVRHDGSLDMAATADRGAALFDGEGARPGDCGLYVPVGDAEGLAAAIQLVTRDAELRLRLGREGRETATLHFGVDRYIATLAAALLGTATPAERWAEVPA